MIVIIVCRRHQLKQIDIIKVANLHELKCCIKVSLVHCTEVNPRSVLKHCRNNYLSVLVLYNYIQVIVTGTLLFHSTIKQLTTVASKHIISAVTAYMQHI